SIPTATLGRWHTTRAGPSMRTVAPRSADVQAGAPVPGSRADAAPCAASRRVTAAVLQESSVTPGVLQESSVTAPVLQVLTVRWSRGSIRAGLAQVHGSRGMKRGGWPSRAASGLVLAGAIAVATALV